MKIPGKIELKNFFLLAKKIEKQMKIDEKEKGRSPFYPTKIFIFACFVRVATGNYSYRLCKKGFRL